jgi:hypothetical protein
MLSTIKVIKYLFFYFKLVLKIHVKITKSLRICRKKFCEYPHGRRMLIRPDSSVFDDNDDEDVVEDEEE